MQANLARSEAVAVDSAAAGTGTTGHTFLDVNTFFAPRAGGIRTYHQAKFDYFEHQQQHDYVLVYPGPRFAVIKDSPNITRIEAWGPILSADPRGYRFLIDYWSVFRAIRKLRPALIESGEPWFTGTFLLAMKALGLHRGPLVSIFHSDPIVTHMNDWCARGRLRPLRRLGKNVVAWGLYSLQRRYDVTIVSSESTERHLLALGINVKRIPFGVPGGFLDTPAPDRTARGTIDGIVRLLYAGRLNQEKDAKLVLDSLPRLLSDPRVHVTVIGRGPLAPYFAMFQHPRYRFPGFVEDRDEVRRIFDAHDILLAPTHETFGLAAIEGMARGLVLIAPDHGNTAYLLRQAGSPFLFAAGDIDDFQDKVRDAVDSDRRLHSLRAREIAERYGSFRAAIERLTAFYIAMLEERGIKNS